MIFTDIQGKFSQKGQTMANNISNSLGSAFSSLNSLFNSKGAKNANSAFNNGLGNGLANLNSALAKGNKESIMNAAKELQAGESYGSSYQADFMQASFSQSGGNFTFQLSALSLSGTSAAFNTGDMMGTYSKTSASLQTLTITGSMSSIGALKDIFGDIDLSALGYSGKPLNELSQGEAASLVSDQGFFGIDNTAKRVADFVLNGAGDNLDMLKAGRDGVVRGYNEAEKIWGSTLPEISQKTQEKLLEMIDNRIAELSKSTNTNGNLLNSEI